MARVTGSLSHIAVLSCMNVVHLGTLSKRLLLILAEKTEEIVCPSRSRVEKVERIDGWDFQSA